MKAHIAGVVLCFGAWGVQAQDAGLPLWEIGAFGGMLSTPAYPASTDRAVRSLVLPYFIYRGEVLRADRGGFGARLVRLENFELDVGFAASLPSSSNDIPFRKNMPELGTLIEFGPRLKMKLANPTLTSSVRLELPIRAVLEFNDGVRQQGATLEPELVLESRDMGAGWSGSVHGSLVFGDGQLNQYFYGVPESYATATRPVYNAQAGLISARLNLKGSKAITPDVRVFAYLRYEDYSGSANRSSPLFLQSYGTSAGVGLTWTLVRSVRSAQN